MTTHVVDTSNFRGIFCTIAMLSISSIAIFHAAFGRAQSPAAAPPASSTQPASAAVPAFEAATIKLVKEPNPGRMNDRAEGRRYTTRYTTLRDLLMMAYNLDPRQIIGGPGWVTTDEYDIDAVAADGVPAAGNWNVMLQKLLADRFQLTFHREQREMPVYALVVAKGGPKGNYPSKPSRDSKTQNNARQRSMAFSWHSTNNVYARRMASTTASAIRSC
jgi:uncharacterized protein (TIGR03435 family)